MNRRDWFKRLTGGMVAAAVLTEQPVFGKNETGEDVVSVPILLKRADVEEALKRELLPAYLRDQAASVTPLTLAMKLASTGWLKRGRYQLEMAESDYWEKVRAENEESRRRRLNIKKRGW